MNLFQLADAHLGVDRCGFEFNVAQHRLDVTDVSTVFEHERSHRMAKQMA